MSQFIEEYYSEKRYLQKLRPHVIVIRGVSYKPSDIKEKGASNSMVILRSNNIENGRINFDDVVSVDSERVSDSQALRPGDIVMCGSNGSKKLVGKAAMMDVMPKDRYSFGAFCLGIRCKETIHPKFLSTFFQTSTYRETIESLGAGSNILNIKPEHIYDLMVPVPPMDEQLKFVSIVQEADKSEFGGSKSQFIEMFGDKEQNVKNGVLGDFCALKAGKSVNADEIQSDSGDGNYPCYGGNGLRGYVTTYSHEGEYIIIGRQGALCGNVNIAQGRFYATEHAIVVSPKEDINCCWLYYALKEMHLNQYARGVAQPGLAVNQLERLPFGVPSLDRQNKFESIYQQADKSENVFHKSIETIDQDIKSLINENL